MQNPNFLSPSQLTNTDLLAEIQRLARTERATTAHLVACLAELDERRLYLAHGYPSLFKYCTDAVGMTEDEAYFRIHAARLARRFPTVLEMLAAGSIHLTTLRLISGHLTGENARALLAAVAGKSKREVEEYVARLCPQPDQKDSIRKLPQPVREASAQAQAAVAEDRPPSTPVAAAPEQPLAPQLPGAAPAAAAPSVSALAPPSRPVLTPIAPERYKIAFTIDAATRAKLEEVQNLIRHAVPSGDLATIFDRALTVLLAQLQKQKFARTDRPRPSRSAAPGSRSMPAEVRRAVSERDDDRCAFVSETGKRCEARAWLEFHHTIPHAVGGEATVETVELRCAAHNRYESELFFGTRHPAASKGPARSGPSSA